MGKLIDADALHPEDYALHGSDLNNAYAMIENAPAVDATPVIHAEWRFDSGCGRVKHYRCTRCGRTVCTFGYKPLLEQFPYCNCGAKMGGPEDGKAD